MQDIPRQKRYALGWYNEGITHLSMHEYEEALSFFERALKVVPDHPDFLIGKGEVLMATGQYTRAYQHFLMAATREPGNLKALVLLGSSLLKLDTPGPADEAFLAALTLNRYDGEAWFGHGAALYNLGRKEEAREAFWQALRKKPNQPELLYYLAKTARNEREALEFLTRGCRLDPTNVDLLHEMAERLIALGHYEEAAAFCTRAGARCPGNPRTEDLIKRCMEGMIREKDEISP
ncbi:tetratricopeptide repeat protein [Methanofollis ethanolicus]|uniref:tetratricopeptide repeat protein n=1 Tax=Methanofollis ethanolicus TaxID=488124 RepID=UPI00128FBFBA|nr:tetratricopeptide repeat protein [Methanofollis ethanolicus]